jgi:glutaminyl-tRNA synthetase
MSHAAPPKRDFIRELVADDVATGRFGRPPATRFPPEPNGFLHIGHAKSICLNFGIAQEFDGSCNLRFDDTNPFTEDIKYVEAIKRDVRWLGFEWDGEYYASDYFGKLYEIAEDLVRKGKAYVDSQSEEAIREGRGTVTVPGTPSPFRDRSVAENLDLLRRMKAGEFADGAHVLRAKIDMASGNLNMRDPTLYRIRRVPHHRTRITTVRVTDGACIRCTILRTGSPTRSRGSPARYAPWSSRTTARSTIGWCARQASRIRRPRSSSRGWSWTTQC